MKNLITSIAAALVLAATTTAWAVNVNVSITSDNAYGFGFGPAAGMTTYYGGIRNVLANEIYSSPPAPAVPNPPSPYELPGVGAEIYTVPAPAPTDYVYILAWSDKSVYQGTLAGFQLPNGPLVSGTGWTVFATGINRNSWVTNDTLTLADLPLINSQIAAANANAGGAGTSKGWVDQNGLLPNSTPGAGVLALGPQNINGAFFGFNAVPGISNQSQWMWYNKDPNTYTNPFAYSGEGSGGHQEFLIFRQQLGEITAPEPSSLVLAAVASAGLMVCVWRRRRWAASRRSPSQETEGGR
jgi:hypothetical protein